MLALGDEPHGIQLPHEEIERRKRIVLEEKARDKVARGPGAYDLYPPLSAEVEKSIRRYASDFSTTPRFAKSPDRVDVDYNVDQGRKKSMATELQQTPRKYAAAFSSTDYSHRERNEELPATYDPDFGVKQSLATSVEKSMNQVGTMRSNVVRFKPPSENVDLMLDPDVGVKESFATAVAKSPRKYSHVFSGTPREFGPKDDGGPDPLKYADNVDYGHKSSIARSLQETPRRYDMPFKAVGRKDPPPPDAVEADYEVNLYDIQQRVLTTPRRYHVMSSQTPRFRANVPQSRGEHGDLNMDIATKQTVATKAEKGPIRYASSFSSTPRFREAAPEYSAKFYDLEFGSKKSVARSVSDASVNYSVMRSVTPRFRKQVASEAPPLGAYETNQGNKVDMFQKVLRSGRNFSAMRSSVPRDSKKHANPDLGPGTYDPRPPSRDVKPLSSLASKTPRSGEKYDYESNQARGIDVQRDNKVWLEHGRTIPKTSRFQERAPDYEPMSQNFLEADRRNWLKKGRTIPKANRFVDEEIDAIIASSRS
eukprot:TRINITY_DN1717_c0_g1_i3.p1 TRINITY_DN1717_c0_g1~~TRINITY_DN1717_c0_g1_i3.p1  ORF type:complete len:537 (-),score=112.63 TRINITY_DN1717_c0_g1_i3:457-2067(-)